MERLNRSKRNKAARIQVIKDEMTRIDKMCSKWKDSGDRGACYEWEGYSKLRKELEELERQDD